ncbi:uncharacterized protein LOC117254656 isoform X3 [Epinephelus lanceolatus]|uniref:uncharacterized protein LOC117254656 isoform X2 n=1 Tax=Epinephelus lanceolatus TaxID=310571 RepID=UPI001446E135|nr:uncharacterized protein LOC117254656 isoform X2 [Epinephelus lanceolatus]
MDHDYALTVAVPVNKPVKRKRTGQASDPRRIWDKKRAKSRINIGVAFPRWRELRENLGLQFDADLACFLLDSYAKYSMMMASAGTCRQKPAAPSRPGRVAAASFVEMEVTIEEEVEEESNSVKNRLSDLESDMESTTESTELSAPGADNSCDGDVYVPVMPQSHKTSELKLECEEEELEPWQKHTLHVRLKEEHDVGELSDDKTDCKPNSSSLQSWAAGQHTVTPEACGASHTSEGHQISNNPMSLSSVQSPEVYAASSDKLQSDQSNSQTFSVPFPPPCLTAIKLEPTET